MLVNFFSPIHKDFLTIFGGGEPNVVNINEEIKKGIDNNDANAYMTGKGEKSVFFCLPKYIGETTYYGYNLSNLLKN